MNTFGGIAEGKTDFAVINQILAGYFDNRDININWIQPQKFTAPAGWDRVFKSCSPEKLKKAFQANKYIIIHIDTDVSPDFGISHQDESGEILMPEQLVEKVVDKFRLKIGEDFYDKYAERIIFAIAVHSIECWLLPLHFSTDEKSQIEDCCQILKQTFSDFKEKDYRYYEEISSKYSNNEYLLKLYSENQSLKIFIEEIENRKIVISKDY